MTLPWALYWEPWHGHLNLFSACVFGWWCEAQCSRVCEIVCVRVCMQAFVCVCLHTHPHVWQHIGSRA